jgi:hypothetical protein
MERLYYILVSHLFCTVVFGFVVQDYINGVSRLGGSIEYLAGINILYHNLYCYYLPFNNIS